MSGGIYTTQPRTKYLDRLKDVTITSPYTVSYTHLTLPTILLV